MREEYDPQNFTRIELEYELTKRKKGWPELVRAFGLSGTKDEIVEQLDALVDDETLVAVLDRGFAS